MNEGTTVPAGVVASAIAADELRIGNELMDTVIRDLFGVGLALQSALPHVTGHAEERLTVAIESIDGVIRAIRNVVFGLELPAQSGPEG